MRERLRSAGARRFTASSSVMSHAAGVACCTTKARTSTRVTRATQSLTRATQSLTRATQSLTRTGQPNKQIQCNTGASLSYSIGQTST